MDPSSGQAQLVQALEILLAQARAGEIGYLAALAASDRGPQIIFSAGSEGLENVAVSGLRRLTGAVGAKVLNRTLPERDESLGADYVCYNLAVAPLCFDFAHWLIDQEMRRVREGAPAPLKVAFWCGRNGQEGLHIPARKAFFENVVRPMLPMLGAVETENTGGRFRNFYGLRDVAAGYRAGEAVPQFRSKYAAPGHGYVTITLREKGAWEHRNSNVAAWLRFARDLKARGERVIFVRDTAKAHEPLEDWETCPEASIDLHRRVALYQGASINLSQCNGPSAMTLFMDRPWLAFSEPVPDGHAYFMGSPTFWRFNGIEQGEQYPWCGPDQRLVWSKDDYEAICAAWEARPKQAAAA